MSHPVTLKNGSHWLIHDPDTPFRIEDWLFDPDQLQARNLLSGVSQGRRSAWFFSHADMPLVLRHYWRGGMVARLTADVHGWNGLKRSRPYRELNMLRQLREAGLPAPRPVACRLIRSGPFYRGDIITGMIPGSDTFAQRIRNNELTSSDWRNVGRMIRRFHEHGACHADLNVRNILLDTDGRPWLIDWDQSSWRKPGNWRRETMERLRRSLSREADLESQAEVHWPALLGAYRGG